MYVRMYVCVYIYVYVGNVCKTEVRAASLEEWFSALPGTHVAPDSVRLRFACQAGEKRCFPRRVRKVDVVCDWSGLGPDRITWKQGSAWDIEHIGTGAPMTSQDSCREHARRYHRRTNNKTAVLLGLVMHQWGLVGMHMPLYIYLCVFIWYMYTV